MLKVVIIDDEQDARFLLRHALEKQYSGSIEIIAEANSVRTGKAVLQSHQPDLVFLDIEMNDGTGFLLLEELSDFDFDLVFVTAYDQFALKAFDFFALGYLVKPFKNSSLYNMVDKFLKQKQRTVNPGLKILTKSYQHKELSKIVISSIEGFNVLDLEDIYYVKSDNNYSVFFLKNGDKKTSSKTLKEYERLLIEKGFYRAHQQYLVNLNYVSEYNKVGGGQIIMSNGDYLPVGRRRLAEFRKQFL